MIRYLSLCAVVLLAALPARAEDPMTPQRMFEIVQAIDPEANAAGNQMTLTIAEVPVLIIFDVVADRMRALTPIRSSEGIAPEEMHRMMQANFDTALDARYSLARGRLWSTFIHPLSPLEKDQLLSGLGQVANLALAYGSTYASGGITFGGGDSNALIQDLLKKGEKI